MKINKNHSVSDLEIIENDIKKVFDTMGNILKTYIYPNEFIAIVNEEIYKNLNAIYFDTLKKYNGNLSGGVGKLKGLYETHKSYQEARIALKYSTKNKKILTYIDSLNLELILESINIEMKNQYIEKILKNLNENEISLLQNYYENDMSLKQTAQDLYIHKNTLQYKLEKINQKCELNPRSFNDSVILYLAITMKINI
jgi:carbohydrate diacid regulator